MSIENDVEPGAVERKARAWIWFKQRMAELTDTTLDANGDFDEDALTEEKVHGAMAIIEAEVVIHGFRRLMDSEPGAGV